MILSSGNHFESTIGWIIVLMFLVVCAIGASKPLQLDNMDFPAVAEATAQSGVPVYYRGEANPQHLGLYHPPLYIYLLALWFKGFGAGPAQARMFGAVCALLQGACVLLLLRELFGKAYTTSAAPWFWALFLLNAYTVQTAAIADIDSTIYGPLILVFLWTVLRTMWRDNEWRTDPIAPLEVFWIGLALAVCLWAKLTTIWLVLPFAWLLLVPRLGWLGSARLTAVFSVGGVGGFLLTYMLYGKIVHLPISYTFSFTWMSFRTRGASGGVGLLGWLTDRWHNLRAMGPFMVMWTGLVPWLACIAGSGYGTVWGLRRKDHRILHAGLILALAGLSTAYYCAQTMTFGAAPFKYAAVYWGIIVCGLVVTALPGVNQRKPIHVSYAAVWIALWLITALVSLRFVKDQTLIFMYGRDAHIWPWVVPAAVFCAGLLLWATRRVIYGRSLLAASMALYGGMQAGMAVHQNSQDYATTYDYGQRGFADTVSYVRTHTGPGDVIISMKDIGYAARRRYLENYIVVYGGPTEMERMQNLLRSGTAKLAIFTEAHGQDQLAVNPPLRDWVLRNCPLVASFGDYRVYRPSGN